MSSNNLEITPIAKRIISLTDSYTTDKAFLKKCEIANLSFVTDLKKGRTKTPGADKLAQIVRGTGCLGTWLLTGEGEKYPPRENPAMVGEVGEQYMSRMLQLQRLIESLEQHKADWNNIALPPGLAVQSARLTATILEAQQAADSDSDL